jgi:hypothetical protein
MENPGDVAPPEGQRGLQREQADGTPVEVS